MGCIHRWVSRGVLAMTLICSAGLWVDGLNGTMTIAVPLLAGLVAIGLWHSGWLGLGKVRGVRKATWTASGLWYLTRVDGTRHEALLLPDSQTLPGVFVLRWRHAGGRTQTVIFAVSLPADLSRRLRIRLRYEASPPAHAFEPGAA